MSDEMTNADGAHHDLMIVQLSSLVDGDLSAADRAEVDTHLELCEQCRTTLEGLRAVKAWMSSDSATPADRAAPAGWSQLRTRLPRRSVAARAGGWRRLAIAASVLVVVTASAMWWKASSPTTPSRTHSPAVAPLEALARERLATLPAAKSQALRSSLRIIDGAIADAYAARVADPANDFVATYLDDLLKRKADALREVIEMTDAESTS
jgi:anti-sigma factor RsiW